jgi:glycosyltransferase involved in cell wall biosynthesis
MNSGGAERVISILSNQLSHKGYDICLVTLTKGESFYDISPTVKSFNAGLMISKKNAIYRLFSKAANLLNAFKFIKNIINQEKPDVIISFLTETNLIAIKLKKHFNHSRLIISERADPRVRNLLVKIMIRKHYQRADYLVCQTQVIADWFKIKSEKTKIIYNPITNISRYSKKEMHYNNEIKLISIGRLTSQKRYDVILEALKSLDENIYKYRYNIYGEGPLKNKLHNMVLKYKIDKNVNFKGKISNIFDEIKSSDILIMTSDYEGFPNALIEAISMGLPVITTNFNEDISNYILDNNMGYVINKGNVRELSNKIKYIIENRNQIIKYSNKQHIIWRDMNIEKVVNEWEKLIN